jgi:hypothetical protein
MTPIPRRAVLGSLLATCALMASSCGHHAADQTARTQRSVEAVSMAVPRNATGVTMGSSPVTWIEGCSTITGSRSGWTPAQTTLSFTDHDPGDAIVSAIDRSLRRAGWTRHDLVNTPGQGPVAAWLKSVGGARPAVAETFAAPAGSSNWVLSARWQPPGPVGQGCP